MADTKRKRDPQFVSPVGTFKFPALHEPSYGSKDYPKPEGVWDVRLLLKKDDPVTKAFIAKLAPQMAEAEAFGQEQFDALPKPQRVKIGAPKLAALYADVFDKETEEPTGDIEFRFKLPASGTYKKGPNAGKTWTATPLIFDSTGKRLNPVPAIWGGTKGQISFSTSPYFIAATGEVGLRKRLIGAMIKDLVTKGDRSAESLGFDINGDGFAMPDGDDDADTSTSAKLDDEIPF